MDLIGLLWGAGVLSFGGLVYGVWRFEQREKAKTGSAPTAAQVALQVETAVGNAVQNIPRIVSDEVARLEGVVSDLTARAEKAEADFAAEHAASIARVETTGAAIAKALSDLGQMTADEAAALTADLSPEVQRIKTAMSQAGDDLVAQINALKDRVAQVVTDGATAEAEKADHQTDIANIGQAVQGLAAVFPTQPPPGG